MKLPYSWLKEYVKTKFSADDIAEKLTMAGLEVEEVISEVVFTGVVIGEIITKEKHPNADKLNVAKVRITPPLSSLVTRPNDLQVGQANPGISSVPSEGDPRLRKDDDGTIQIVCGAPNLAAGQKVPVALVGAKLGDFEIGKAKLRGIESNGMICSEKELGISEEHDGIMVLEQDAPVGADFGEYLGHEEVIDVDVLANRPDCMSIIGLSREVSALTGEKITLPKVVVSEKLPAEKIVVTIKDNDLCPRYTSRVVKNVSYAETPIWMRERLLACGVRSMDLLVDISNYVMLEYGQPLHFFDLDKLISLVIPAKAGIQEQDGSLGGRPGMTGEGVEIIVRKAAKGEEITTLDGIKRKLTPDNLVIADSSAPIALAGVMGGLVTEIDKNTKNIFIEAAVFDKASVRKTSRSLGLRSEAVARYEKGIGLASPLAAIDRAAQLLTELAGGEVCAGLGDTYVGKLVQKPIELELSKLNKFLGTTYPDNLVTETLEALGFTLKSVTNGKYQVTAPEWRVDIYENVDLYEEVARVVGFDSIPATLPTLQVTPRKNKLYEFSYRVRGILAGMGFTEIMTYSFASEKELTVTGTKSSEALEVANPLVKEQRYLRVSLVPKMLESLAANQYHHESVHFFEIGKTFEKQGKGLPLEKTWLIFGVIGGSSWPMNLEAPDFYDLKGATDSLLSSLGIAGYDEKLGDLGSVSVVKTEIAAAFGLKRPVAVAQIDMEKLLSVMPTARIYHEISRYQKVERDITFDIKKSQQVGEIISRLTHPLIKQVTVTDVYEGKGVESTSRAVTVRLEIVSSDHTLTDKEVEKVVKVCQNEVAKLGGKIRGVKS